MGTFLGHVVPGTFFIFFSLWGLISSMKEYYEYYFQQLIGSKSLSNIKKKKVKQIKFVNKCSIRSRLGSTEIPLESILRITAIVIGTIGEFVTAWKQDGSFEKHNLQHMTMFLFFGFGACFDILIYYKIPLPGPKIDYLVNGMAFLVEAILFLWHLHGRGSLDIQIHTYLIYSLVFTIVSIIGEAFFENIFTFQISRHGCILLQGTWFYQIAFILYNPLPQSKAWDQNSHGDILIASVLYALHIAVIIFVIIIIATFAHFKAKNRHKFHYEKLQNLHDENEEEEDLESVLILNAED